MVDNRLFKVIGPGVMQQLMYPEPHAPERWGPILSGLRQACCDPVIQRRTQIVKEKVGIGGYFPIKEYRERHRGRVSHSGEGLRARPERRDMTLHTNQFAKQPLASCHLMSFADELCITSWRGQQDHESHQF